MTGRPSGSKSVTNTVLLRAPRMRSGKLILKPALLPPVDKKWKVQTLPPVLPFMGLA